MIKNTLNILKVLSVISFGIGLPSYAAGSPLASSEDSQKHTFDMNADTFTYSQDGQNLTASGHVEIISQYGSVWADKVIYSVKNQTLKATGNVIYADENNLTSFVEELSINNKLKTAVLEKLRMEIRHGESAPRLVAEKAERTQENILTLENIAYTPCKTCALASEEDIPWRIRAKKLVFDENEGHMTYNNAYLDIYGKPLIYMPWFRHPMKNVAVNGMLPPSFGSSTSNGFKASSAYYHQFTPSQDMTLRATHYSKRGTQISPEFRSYGKRLYTELRGSFIEDERTDDTRSHFQTKTEYVSKPGTRIGFAGEFATDDSYMFDFYDRNDAYLSTEIYAEDASLNHYKAASISRYQDLKTGAKDEDTPHILPHLTYEKTYYLDQNYAHSFTTFADFTSLSRTDGDEVRRLITQASYQKTHFTQNGHRFVFDNTLRGDIYQIDSEETNSHEEDGMQSRLFPQMAITWDHAYISLDNQHKITPKAMLVLAPPGHNSAEIPNEDSLDYDLDTNNLFSPNRFAGFDRVESGSRFVYGLDNHWGTAEEVKWRFFLGQSLRFQHDEDLETASRESKKQSDIVAIFEGDSNQAMSFRSDLRLDPSDLNANRMDNMLFLGHKDTSYLSVRHTFVEDGPAELRLIGGHRFNKEWSVKAETRKDLEDEGRTLISKGSLIWTNQCYRVSLTAQRSGYDNDTVEPATEYTLNLELLTFGRE